MHSPAFLVIRTAFKEKVNDPLNSFTNMQQEKEASKEATSCKEWKKMHGEEEEEGRLHRLIKKQN